MLEVLEFKEVREVKEVKAVCFAWWRHAGGGIQKQGALWSVPRRRAPVS